MDIRDFYKTNYQTEQNSNENKTPNSSQNFDEYQQTIDKYKNLSQDELVSELISQATELKSQGKLNTDMLNQLSTTLSPMLNSEQQNLLSSIIERLK